MSIRGDLGGERAGKPTKRPWLCTFDLYVFVPLPHSVSRTRRPLVLRHFNILPPYQVVLMVSLPLYIASIWTSSQCFHVVLFLVAPSHRDPADGLRVGPAPKAFEIFEFVCSHRRSRMSMGVLPVFKGLRARLSGPQTSAPFLCSPD